MNSDQFIKGLEPVMKMAVESNLWSKTIARHYKETISKLTGKSEKEIEREMQDIFDEVQEETINKIQTDGSKG